MDIKRKYLMVRIYFTFISLVIDYRELLENTDGIDISYYIKRY